MGSDSTPDNYDLWSFQLLCHALAKKVERERMLALVKQANEDRAAPQEDSDGMAEV